MKRLRLPRFAVLGAVAAIVIGGAVGAVAATSSSHRSTPRRARTRPRSSARLVSDTRAPAHATPRHRAGARRTLAAAAGYLGLSVQKLRQELREGRSLAQIARSLPGKSEEGLVSRIIKAQQPKQFTKVATRLSKRVSAQVRRPGGPHVTRRVSSLRLDALAYLKIAPAQLRVDQRAGKSLAEVVKTIPGKSEAGLIEALVSTRRQQLEAAEKAGLLKRGSSVTDLATLQRRITFYVRHTPHRVSPPATPATRSSS